MDDFADGFEEKRENARKRSGDERNDKLHMEKKKIVVSGIRPTGNIHLGNYFGAIRNFVRMQDEYQCYFFIADYHSLTTHPHPEHLRQNVKQILATYVACGMDPEKVAIYVQSDLPETAELYLILNMNVYLGELMRCTSFKEKAKQYWGQLRKELVENLSSGEGQEEKAGKAEKEGNKAHVSAGLLTYPTLMAADILIHKADFVPVGKDQEQHLEMTRAFAHRFNSVYGVDCFGQPQAFNFGENLIKIPGLDGSGKMGKSESGNNAIFLTDEDAVIRKKIMRATTDSGPVEMNQQKPEAIANLFQLVRVLCGEEAFREFDAAYNRCDIRYGDMKKQLAEDTIKFVAPFRARIGEILSDDAFLEKIRRQGQEKARESAVRTVREVRGIIGF